MRTQRVPAGTIGPADMYVIHAHEAPFFALYDALLSWRGRCGYFFIDVFCLQPPAAERPRHERSHAGGVSDRAETDAALRRRLAKSIASIGRAVMVIDWHTGATLKRSKCLFEASCALQLPQRSDSESSSLPHGLHFAMTPEDREALQKLMTFEDYARLVQQLAGVDAGRAQAREPQARDAILAAFRMEHGGVEAVNDRVGAAVRLWLVRLGLCGGMLSSSKLAAGCASAVQFRGGIMAHAAALQQRGRLEECIAFLEAVHTCATDDCKPRPQGVYGEGIDIALDLGVPVEDTVSPHFVADVSAALDAAVSARDAAHRTAAPPLQSLLSSFPMRVPAAAKSAASAAELAHETSESPLHELSSPHRHRHRHDAARDAVSPAAPPAPAAGGAARTGFPHDAEHPSTEAAHVATFCRVAARAAALASSSGELNTAQRMLHRAFLGMRDAHNSVAHPSLRECVQAGTHLLRERGALRLAEELLALHHAALLEVLGASHADTRAAAAALAAARLELPVQRGGTSCAAVLPQSSDFEMADAGAGADAAGIAAGTAAGRGRDAEAGTDGARAPVGYEAARSMRAILMPVEARPLRSPPLAPPSGHSDAPVTEFVQAPAGLSTVRAHRASAFRPAISSAAAATAAVSGSTGLVGETLAAAAAADARVSSPVHAGTRSDDFAASAVDVRAGRSPSALARSASTRRAAASSLRTASSEFLSSSLERVGPLRVEHRQRRDLGHELPSTLASPHQRFAAGASEPASRHWQLRLRLGGSPHTEAEQARAQAVASLQRDPTGVDPPHVTREPTRSAARSSVVLSSSLPRTAPSLLTESPVSPERLVRKARMTSPRLTLPRLSITIAGKGSEGATAESRSPTAGSKSLETV